MIINSSRASNALSCWRKAFNWHHRRLTGSTSVNLVDGGAFHEAVAVGMASKDWKQALVAGREKFDAEIPRTNFLPEEFYLIEEHWKLVEKMVACYRDNYQAEQYEVVQPECEFDVELPGSMHNCIFQHHVEIPRGTGSYHPIHQHPNFDSSWEKWNPPNPEAILEKRIRSPHYGHEMDAICPCYTPHRLAGKTDAIVIWNFTGTRGLWLLEHKTTAISGAQFWDQWLLDLQPTVYLYGVWKSLGIRPSGFIMNAINKPSEAQVGGWNNRRKYGPPKTPVDYISYERQPFLRTEEDLLRCEREMTELCDEWEERVIKGRFNLTPIRNTCLAYNRKCEYHGMCCSHDAESEMESFARRSDDYIDVKFATLLNGKGATITT